jgi:alkylation response protein AidB-like acyl-CoA dehydrogenase
LPFVLRVELGRLTELDNSIVQAFDVAAALAAERRDAAEAAGRLDDDVVAALLQAGVARLYLPRSLGGLEVSPLTCARVTERLAGADPAAAWFVMVANAARLMAQYWPESLAEEIFADPDVVVAASGNRPFTATPCAGGIVLAGTNSFVSGCHHARWLLSPVLRDEGVATALIPMAECTIVDNWHALGMRGTGSNDVAADGVFVPDTHVVPMQETPTRNRYFDGTLYRCPSRILFATYVPVFLVLAEQALAELSALAGGKTPYADDRKLKHRSLAQIKFGRALATYRAGREYFLGALEAAWEQARAGQPPSTEDKADLYLAGTHAAQSAAQVVRWVADAAGTSVIYEGRPLERIVRDMETLRHHGFVSESRYGSVAQVFWDADLDYQLLLR